MYSISNSSKMNSGKMIVATGAILFSTLIPSFGVAAAATTTPTVVPNTNTCYSGTPISSTYDTSSKQGSFTATWNDDNTFTVKVTTPLTKNVTVYVSDYILTSSLYQGGCFSRDAATGTYPQTWFKTETYTLAKNFVGTKTLSVDLPTTCANLQVDLYYGKADSSLGMVPLNDSVTQKGHDDYNFITGNIMATANNPACAPGKGSETPVTPVTPVTPTTPQVLSTSTTTPATAAVADQLTDTGLNIWVTSLLAAATMASAIFVATRKRVSNS
jgi:hypothetical protein